MLSAARVNIVRILSCIKVASISLFNPPSPLPPYHSASSVAPPSGCSLRLSFLNQLGAFISWPLPISPALPSLCHTIASCSLFPSPCTILSALSVPPSVSTALCQSRDSFSTPLLALLPHIHLFCHPLLSFVFTSTSIFIHLSPSLSLSSPLPHPFFVPLWTSPFFFFVLSLSVCSLILLSHHSVPACLSGSIHSCTSAGSRQHERWLKNSFEVMKWHCKGSFTHDILRCSS